MLHGTPLQGDGISIPFFHLLWTKNQTKTSKHYNKKQPQQQYPNNNILRIPDTIIFKFGLPQQWYFTSKQNHKIQKKRKQNTTTDKVKEAFINNKNNKNTSKDGNDIIAYFIHLPHFQDDDIEANTNTTQHNNSNKAASKSNCKEKESSSGIESNNIEYLNKEALNSFLCMACHKQSTGILQRFIHDPITTPFNSLIRAIHTPNLCVLERRITKQSMYDSNRFGLYERVITFEGPEVYSRSVPLRGNVLSGCMKQLCDEIVEHIFDVTKGEDNKEGVNVTQMVLYLKVDTKERIWILWSSSIRVGAEGSSNIGGGGERMMISKVNHYNLMSIDNIVQVPSAIQLQLQANHNSNCIVENICPKVQCLSCGRYEKQVLFHPITYKHIITHFEEVLKLLIHTCYNNNQHNYCEEGRSIMWPPDPLMIKAGGGVGFAPLWFSKNENVLNDRQNRFMNRSNNDKNSKDTSTIVEPEDIVIPPMIRELYKRLKVEGYKHYRHDPLFLDKSCLVCETCYLVYANLASTSFQMIAPIYLDNTDDEGTNAATITNARIRKRNGNQRKMIMTASSSSSSQSHEHNVLWLYSSGCTLEKDITTTLCEDYKKSPALNEITTATTNTKASFPNLDSNPNKAVFINHNNNETILFDINATPRLPNPILGVHKNELKTSKPVPSTDTNTTTTNVVYTKKYVNIDIEKMFKFAKQNINTNTTGVCQNATTIAKKKQPLGYMKNYSYNKLQQQQHQQQQGKEQNDDSYCNMKKERKNPYEIPQILR